MTIGSVTTQVTLPSDHEVRVIRRFTAPRALVYRALTTPALVRCWLLGPAGWTMTVCEMDVRAGGSFRWRWRHERDGREFGFRGRYRDVSPARRIVNTQALDTGQAGVDMGGSVLVTTDLTEEAGVTTLVSLMDYGSRQARDAALSTGMSDGVQQTYRRLDEALAEAGPVAT